MSVFGIDNGIPRTAHAVLSGSSATTIVNATDRSNIYLVGLALINVSGGALTPVVDVYDGTTVFKLRDDASLADQAREVLALPEFVHVKKGEVLRVTANTGLHVFASYVEVPANQTQRIAG